MLCHAHTNTWTCERIMAAVTVNRILETMLPHLEELLQSGIFDEKEIKMIVQKRRRFEHRLFSNPPKLDDFLQAIEYELNLDQLRKHRKEKLGVVLTNTDGEFGITNRIHGIYRRALKHFKGDLRLWLQYIDFCELKNQESLLSSLYGRVLAIHPTQSVLWVMAAIFEFERRKDSAAARSIFQQGIKANPENQHLWTEYFRMELLFVDKIAKRRDTLGLDPEEDNENTDAILQLRLPEIVFDHAIKAIPDNVMFRLMFINISLLFNGTEQLESLIYNSIERDFADRALCWESLAKRCWRMKPENYHMKTEEIYQRGLEKVKGNEEETKCLWRSYCEWMLDHTSPEADKLKELVLTSCEGQLITEELSLLLFNRMLQLGLIELVLSLIGMVLKAFPSSLLLWKTMLQLREPDLGSEAFCSQCRDAVESLTSIEDKLSLYQYWIDTLSLRLEDIGSLLKEAVADIRHDAFMERLLEWSFMNGGIKSARKSFKSLQKHYHPLPCSVYLKYLKLEKYEGTPPRRQIIDEALTYHGAASADLWLDVIDTELRQNAFDKVQDLHWRAVHTLKDKDTVEKFTLGYNALTNYVT